MPAELIDGKVVSEKVRNEVAAAVANLPGKPCLAVVLVGDDPASALYVKSKGEKTEAAGMRSITKRFPASATQAEVEAELTMLNGDPEVDGILLQLPLPKGLDEAKALEKIDPAKDVDGLTELSAGRLFLGKPGLRPFSAPGRSARGGRSAPRAPRPRRAAGPRGTGRRRSARLPARAPPPRSGRRCPEGRGG